MFSLPARPITTPDPDATQVPVVVCQQGSQLLTIGALCDTAGAQMDIVVTWTDSGRNYLGSMGPVTLVSQPTADWGGSHRATQSDGSEPVYHCGGYYAYVSVVALRTAAKWSLAAGSQ